MPKPSAATLKKASSEVDLDGFDYEVILETSNGPIRLTLDPSAAPTDVALVAPDTRFRPSSMQKAWTLFGRSAKSRPGRRIGLPSRS